MKKSFPKTRKYLMIGMILILLIVISIFYSITLRQNYQPKTTTTSQTPTSSVIDPKIKEFGLKIEKLNILVPVMKNVDGSNKLAYDAALKNGVAHFKGTGLPGKGSNIFIFGHSSAEVKSDYSKIFATLNELENGDGIVLYYQGSEHKYKVKNKEIIEATDLSVLEKGKEEILTLMTCWPIGTKDKRLIIRAQKQ